MFQKVHLLIILLELYKKKQKGEKAMKQKRDIKKPVALLLSIVLTLSLGTAVFAEESFAPEEDEPAVCIMTDECTAETHKEGCPKYVSEINSDTLGKDQVAVIQALIDALPDAETITTENNEIVEKMLNEIDEAKRALNDEQLDLLNIEKYIAAAEALGSFYGVNTLDGYMASVTKNDGSSQNYSSLSEAISNSASGDTITLLADIDNSVDSEDYVSGVSYTLKAGTTLNGNGHTITGHVGIHIPAGGATVCNINFKNIHNNTVVDQSTCDRYGWESKTGNQSAIYAHSLTGKAEITGCTFDDVDWDAIQITPAATTAEIIITDNIFKNTNATASQLRYIHIEHTQYSFIGNQIAEVTITDNQFYTPLSNSSTCSIGVWYISGTKTNTVKVNGNYIEDINSTEVAELGREKLYPMRSNPDVDVDDYSPAAYSGTSVYNTLADAVADMEKTYINLMRDNSEEVTVPTGHRVILYPNSYKLTGTIINNGDLKLTIGTNEEGSASIVNNGTLDLSCNAATAYNVTNNGVLKITGGAVYDLGKITGNGTVEISGGTFTTEPGSNMLAAWYKAVEQDGNYKVLKMTLAEAIEKGVAASSTASGGTFYSSITEAVNSSSSSYLQKDSDEAVVFNVGGTYGRGLYFNGYSFTGSIQINDTVDFIRIYGESAILSNVTGKKLCLGTYNTKAEVTINDADLETLDVSASSDCTIAGGNYQEIIIRKYYKSGETEPTYESQLVITGGTFISDKVKVLYTGHTLDDGTSEEEISLSEFVPEGYDVVDNGDGTYTICDHTPSEAWSSDDSEHWHECSCGQVFDKAAHTAEWVVEKQATYSSSGKENYVCKVCGRVIETRIIPMKRESTTILIGISDKADSKGEENPNTGADVFQAAVIGAEKISSSLAAGL